MVRVKPSAAYKMGKSTILWNTNSSMLRRTRTRRHEWSERLLKMKLIKTCSQSRRLSGQEVYNCQGKIKLVRTSNFFKINIRGLWLSRASPTKHFRNRNLKRPTEVRTRVMCTTMDGTWVMKPHLREIKKGNIKLRERSCLIRLRGLATMFSTMRTVKWKRFTECRPLSIWNRCRYRATSTNSFEKRKGASSICGTSCSPRPGTRCQLPVIKNCAP